MSGWRLGPHDQQGGEAGKRWARSANCVKAVGNPAVLHAAPDHALRIWRWPWSNVEQDRFLESGDAESFAAATIGPLNGYHHPRLFVEGPNEIARGRSAEVCAFYALLKDALARRGYLCTGPCWATGDYEAADVELLRAINLPLWNVHGYMTLRHGPTIWNAYRMKQFWRPGDPPVVYSECGYDRCRDGPNGTYVPAGDGPFGWREQFAGTDDPEGLAAAGLIAYARGLTESWEWGATVFTSSPNEEWRAKGFDMDPLVDRLGALYDAWGPDPLRPPVVPVTPPPVTRPVPPPAVAPVPNHPPPATPTDELRALARTIAAQHRLDWPVTDRQITAESNWNPRAVSRSGAKGLMQLMDATARDLGVTDSFDPRQNLDGGMRYMRFLLTKYGGSYAKALAAYNWGPGNLDRLLATNPTGWRAGISAQARAYLAKIKPPPEVPMADIDLSDIPVEEMLSTTHFTKGRAKTTLVVIHATRSGDPSNSISAEANGTAIYMDNDSIPEKTRVSSHLVIGNAKVFRVVHDQDTAWHAGTLNAFSIGIEVAQGMPQAPYHPRQFEFAAKATARYCVKYKIPIRRVMDESETGIIGHEDSRQGKGYGKSDPGPMWDWELFIAQVKEYAGGGAPVAPTPTKPTFDIAKERDVLWAAAERLEKGGHTWLGQAVKSAVALSKSEK